jgi:hypothetical protein
MMEATGSSKPSIYMYHTARRHIPEDVSSLSYLWKPQTIFCSFSSAALHNGVTTRLQTVLVLISSWRQEAWTVREQAANLFAASVCRCVLALTEEVCSWQSYLASTKRGSTIWTPTAVKTWHFIILFGVSYLKDLDRLLKAKPSCTRQLKKVGCGHICFMEKKVLPAQKINCFLPRGCTLNNESFVT